ncbi:hypothetical protein KFK09_013340 [Dendrobium nobile]|uniref:Uncharacterized protein n=1 Tax=Dendrobium nobile TaxID=94219 RepID=A0A8T3B8T7_DENNO|nr:hypothetical protein KFK09_013340 [Dendrobium nobile]
MASLSMVEIEKGLRPDHLMKEIPINSKTRNTSLGRISGNCSGLNLNGRKLADGYR